jgi:N6-adenosine-specific RNA methylase IME4
VNQSKIGDGKVFSKEYDIIYADPPWKYSFSKSGNRKVENHYPTMTLEEIKSIKVPAKKDCILFLWATAPKLIESIEVLKSWGFTYKTHCIWNKEIIGMGYWFRGQHELLLVGTKGKISPPDIQHRFSSIHSEKRNKHSKKPDYYRNWISSAFPDKTKIELFARERIVGWDAWGNEV